jgi:GNAT superfamily N-acetyltransferase
MKLQAILDCYDHDQRCNAEIHGARREWTPAVIRHVSLHDTRSYITYSRVSADTADDAIREQIRYFARLGHTFEWTVFSHDPARGLQERLLRHGFEPEETETIVVLELETMCSALTQPVAHDVRRIRDVEDLGLVVAVKAVDTGREPEGFSLKEARLERDLREIPDKLSVYVAFCEGAPACAGWLRFDPASPFASLWGGSTRPEYRRRGLYTALVAVRAQEARDRGARFLTVDAQSLSRPILEKLGFRALTVATPMVWRPPQPEADTASLR